MGNKRIGYDQFHFEFTSGLNLLIGMYRDELKTNSETRVYYEPQDNVKQLLRKGFVTKLKRKLDRSCGLYFNEIEISDSGRNLVEKIMELYGVENGSE